MERKCKHKEFKTSYYFFFCVYMYIWVYVYVGVHNTQCTSGNKKTTFRSQFSLATQWSGLAVYMASPTGPSHQPHIKHFKLSLGRILQTFQVFLLKNILGWNITQGWNTWPACARPWVKPPALRKKKKWLTGKSLWYSKDWEYK